MISKSLLLKVLVILLILVGGAAVYWKFKPVVEFAPENTQEGSVPDVSSFKPVSAQIAMFYTKANIPDRRRTFVQIPYYYESGSRREMWLSLETESGTSGVIVLVDHPIFDKLTGWQRLDSPSASLYQKKTKYTSVVEFWNQPPEEAKILADPFLVYKKQLATSKMVTPLSADVNIDEFDYVITTYREPVEKGNHRVFETTVDASQAVLNDKQEMFWKLDIPSNNQGNRIFLGEIHIDYRVGM